MRRWFGVSGAIAAALLTPFAVRAEDPTWPVVVHSVGPKHIRLRIAIGAGLPCSSSINRILYEGPIEPEETVLLRAPVVPICVEHTYGTFPETQWAPAQHFPAGCRYRGPCNLPSVVRVVISSEPERGP